MCWRSKPRASWANRSPSSWPRRLALAKDAAEAVQVDYAARPPLAETVVDSLVGDQAATPAAFARARHVVKLRADIQRVTGVPMEPRAALGHFDATSGRYTLYAGGGAIVRPKKEVAIILGIEPERVRVIAREVGGNFGTRNFFYPEFALVCWASRKTGRPVKWTCERHEAFLSDYAGRDFLIESELALDADGRFLGLRARSTSNLGAYTASFVPLTKGTQLMTSLYRMPAMAQARGVLSNTPSTAPYRSAGRPEAMFVIERLIDLAARAHGFDRIALRRRNLITTTPHTNAFGVTYDSGDYRATLDAVLELADWNGFTRRRAETAARGLRRGIGLGGYVELQSGAPAERAELTVLPEGLVEIVIGTLSAGQGHATSFAQLASEWLGVPAGKVRLVTDDSDRAVGGRRLAFRPLDPAGGDHDPPGLARHHRQELASWRLNNWKQPKLTSSSPRAASPSPAPIAASAFWRWRPNAGRSPTRPMSRAGSAPIPMAGMSARSRSTPRPAWPASTATQRSTMSAAR